MVPRKSIFPVNSQSHGGGDGSERSSGAADEGLQQHFPGAGCRTISSGGRVQSGDNLPTVIGQQGHTAADAFKVDLAGSFQDDEAGCRMALIQLLDGCLHSFQCLLIHGR
jgi:hypothetical protein